MLADVSSDLILSLPVRLYVRDKPLQLSIRLSYSLPNRNYLRPSTCSNLPLCRLRVRNFVFGI